MLTLPVIELSGGWRGSTPQFIFNPPVCSQKLPWGQAKPPRAACNSSMYLALCLDQKIYNTCELQDDPIIRGYDSLVDYLLIYLSRCRTCRCSIFVHLCHIHRYVYPSVLWVTRDQKLKRCGMLYRVAQNTGWSKKTAQ